jgi:hypothetical protein
MTDRIDIHDPLAAICAILDLEPRLVSEMTITPTEAVATVYLTREDGKKYIVVESGEPATETLRFKVRT